MLVKPRLASRYDLNPYSSIYFPRQTVQLPLHPNTTSPLTPLNPTPPHPTLTYSARRVATTPVCSCQKVNVRTLRAQSYIQTGPPQRINSSATRTVSLNRLTAACVALRHTMKHTRPTRIVRRAIAIRRFLTTELVSEVNHGRPREATGGHPCGSCAIVFTCPPHLPASPARLTYHLPDASEHDEAEDCILRPSPVPTTIPTPVPTVLPSEDCTKSGGYWVGRGVLAGSGGVAWRSAVWCDVLTPNNYDP